MLGLHQNYEFCVHGIWRVTLLHDMLWFHSIERGVLGEGFSKRGLWRVAKKSEAGLLD